MADISEVTSLVRCRESKKRKYSVIPLVHAKEISLGRGLDVTVQLLSRKRDSMILLSRKHAIFKETDDNKWTITDNKSLNGVYLNDVKLNAGTSFPIEEGDIIQIGAIQEGETEAEFVFQVTKKQLSLHEANEILTSLNPANLGKRKNSQKSLPVIPNNMTDVKPMGQDRIVANVSKRKRSEDLSPSKLHKSVHRPEGISGPSSSNVADKRMRTELSPCKKDYGLSQEEGEMLNVILSHKTKHSFQDIMEMIQSKSISPSKKQQENDLQLMLEEKERLLKEKEEEMTRITETLKAKAQKKEDCLMQQLEEQQEHLLQEKVKMEKEMKEMAENFEAKAQEKELTLMEQLTKQREALLSERQNVEKTLQENLAKQLAEKDESFSKEQEKLRKELKDRITKKEEEMLTEIEAQKMALLVEKQRVEESLQSEVTKNVEQKERLEQEQKRLENVIANKDEEYKSIQQKLEDGQKAREEEEQLKITKAKQEAFDNITEVLESELQCSICAELFIQATTLNCSHSFCKYCITLWMKRKKKCPICRASIHSHNRSIVLDNYIDKMVESLGEDVKKRRQEMLTDRKKTEGEDKTKAVDPPVLISDAEDEDEDDVDQISSDDDPNSEDESYEDGIPGAYFGGYGQCFNCGSGGHWANGCPY